MTQVIGFAGTFYTLWNYSTETVYTTDSYGNHWPVREKTNYNYSKNISMDLETAKALYPGLSIDEGLKGKNWNFSVENKEEDLCPQIMKFGKYVGRDLNELVKQDMKYVLWLADNGASSNSRYAKEMTEIVNHNLWLLKEQQDVINGNDAIFSDLMKRGTITFEAERNLKIHEDFAYITVPVGNIFVTFKFNSFSANEFKGITYALPVINGKAKRIKGKGITLTFTEDTCTEYSVYQAIVNSITIH